MDDAVALLQSWGLEVVLGQTVTASHHQFAGDDDLRTHDLQQYINDDSIKAIFAARGGYGTVRIIDRVDFSRLATHPKWVIGFSDITVLHAHLYTNFNLQTIHGQMPINIPDATATSVETLRKALFGEKLTYELTPHPINRTGHVEGVLVGGNLSILISIAGSVSDLDYTGKILFIEDVGEYLYSVDRMMYHLKRAGKLQKLAGLIAGGFTGLQDNDIPFGQTAQEIIMAAVQEYDYPVCFDFPAGHVSDNWAMVMGKELLLDVQEEKILIKYV
jgi:muramoyltetrapeptide carboxypeptidase